MDASTKRFTNGFFGSKASGKARSLATALTHLHFGEDAFEETFAMTLVDFAHASYLDDIDAYCHVYALRKV